MDIILLWATLQFGLPFADIETFNLKCNFKIGVLVPCTMHLRVQGITLRF
jgi:hypothetical protein